MKVEIDPEIKRQYRESLAHFQCCLGPPCVHFPAWVKTPSEARDYLAYKTLSAECGYSYVNERNGQDG